MQEVRLHSEQMTAEELQFLVKKDEKETGNFYRVISIFMIICFVIPFVVAVFRAVDGEEYAFSYSNYFMGVGYLLVFLGVSAWFAYSRTLRKIKRDIHRRTKTVERTTITRRQYMPQNHTYYFYLSSPNKLSIEVSESDYYMLKDGDELNIEYSTHAKLYFGYF